MFEDEPYRPLRQPRPVGDILLERRPSPIDQVIADVRGAVRGGAARRRLAAALDRPQRHPDLRITVGFGELFHRLTLPVAAQEVHPAVGAGGIALQHLLDQADRLDVLPPVDRRAEAQAGDRIGHRYLVGRLVLVLAADRRFRGGVL